MPQAEAAERPARIVVLHDAPEAYADLLAARFPAAEIGLCRSYEAAPAVLAEVDPAAVLSFKFGRGDFPRDALLARPGLRWIHAGGAGIDHLSPWDPERVTVTNSSGIHGPIMAQYVLCAMLMFNLGLPTYLRQQALRQWQKYDSVLAEGQVLVVVGFGRVGEAVGRLARSVGMRVLGVRTTSRASPHADAVIGVEDLAWAVGQGDYVAITLPLTPATRNLIDRSIIEAMKPGARLVNVARGGIVDEDALLDALRSGRLGGAALDVFEREPLPPDSPFWSLDEVIVTPHSSSDVAGWQRLVAALFADNLERWLAGRPLQNVVLPQKGY